MENATIDDDTDRMVMHNKLCSPNQMSGSVTMDSFQDGGQQNISNTETNFSPMEGMNSEMNNFPPSSGDHGLSTENFNSMHHSQMPGYNSFNRGNYTLGEQHGGMPMAGSTDFGTPISQYHGQFSQSPVRPGYPTMGKPVISQSRPGIGPPGMGMMSPPGYNQSSQRMMSGQTISQQGGPTPTLNQLLQTNAVPQRYPNSYNEFPSGSVKGSEMGGGNMPYNMQQNWNANQRGVGSFPQGSISSISAFRNQSGSVPADMNQQRRPGGVAPGYQPGPTAGSGLYGGQHPGQFPGGGQRFSMMGNQSGRPPGMAGQDFSQQMMHSQYGPMGFGQGMPPSSQPQQQGFMSQQPPTQQLPHPPGQSSPSLQSQNPVPTSPLQALQQQAAQLSQSPIPQNLDQVNAQLVENHKQASKKSIDDDEKMETRSLDENSDSRGTPIPSGHHPLTSLRHIPSPSGSTGSRSNTPASLSGNQAGSPMPPRPPSSQLDGQASRMSQSPMAAQGFNQQMMPPPMGPNQMGLSPAGNKMGGHMGHFSQFNNQYNPGAGNFSRQQNVPGMPNSSNMSNYPSQTMYNGPNPMSQMGSSSVYNNMPMERNMTNTNYNNAYGQSGMPVNMNPMGMNSHYSAYSNHMGAGSSPGPSGPPVQGSGSSPGMGSTMDTNTPTSPQGAMAMSATAKGAQAAAQAAMIAAANSAAGRAQSMRSVPNVPNQARMYGMQGNHSTSQMGHMNHMGPMNFSPHTMPNAMGPMPGGMSPNSMTNSGGFPASGTSTSSKRKSKKNSSSNSGNTGESVVTSLPASTVPSEGGQQNSLPSSISIANTCSSSSTTSSNSSSVLSHEVQDPASSSSNPLPHQQQEPSHLANSDHQSENTSAPISDNSSVPTPDVNSAPTPDNKSSESASVISNLSDSSEGAGDTAVPVSKPPCTTEETPLSAPIARSDGKMEETENLTPATTPQPPEMSQVSQANCEVQPTASFTSVEVSQPITTTVNSTQGLSTTTVTPSITSPVTSVSVMTSAPQVMNSMRGMPQMQPQQQPQPQQQQQHQMPNMNCIPMPSFPDEPPEKKKKEGDIPGMRGVPIFSPVPDEFGYIGSPNPTGVFKSGGDVMKMFEMGSEPDRRPFLEKLMYFLEEKGTPVTTMPVISKQPLDLFKLYLCVREKGGMTEVNKAKKWKEICGVVNIGSSASAAFTLKKNYIKYLFAYECKFDKGGIDPQPILAQMEAALQQKREQKNKRAPSPAGSQGSSQDAFRPPSAPNNQGMDPFSPGMPPPYMQNSESNMGPMGGGMMGPNNMMNPNAMMPSHSNMSHPVSMGGGHNSMQNSMMGGGMPPNGMMPGSMPPQGGMMPGNMPPNSMIGGNVPSNNMMGGSMMNNSMMSGNMPGSKPMMSGSAYNSQQNNAMGNSVLSANSMIGNNTMVAPSSSAMSIPPSSVSSIPSNSDSISVQDPFADDLATSSSQFSQQRPSNSSQVPQFTNIQQPSSSFSSRPGPGPNMPSYPGMAQSNSYSESSSRIPNPNQAEQFNSSDSSSPSIPASTSSSPFPPRQMPPVDSYPSNNSRADSFPPGQVPPTSQFSVRSQSSAGNRFPFGQQFDRPERFDQQSPTHPGQQFRPTVQPGQDPMYSGPYSNQPIRPPQEPFTSSQSFPPGQVPGYPGPRPGISQDVYPGYGAQPGSYPVPRPSMNREMSSGVYGTPSKRYPDMEHIPPAFTQQSPYVERPGPGHVTYASHHEGYMMQYDDARRDMNQWSPMSQRYPNQPGAPNFLGSSLSGMPPGAPGTPPMGPYGRMAQRASPQARDKQYMHSSKPQQKPGTMIANAQFPPKKEIVFPLDSVEAVQPLLAKRRRLTSKDIGSIEAWRLMMALKSGLLAESTWALDTLNILLFDDSTVSYFSLTHLPGLLEVLLEHFRRTLIEMFGICEDIEIGYEDRQKLLKGDVPKECEEPMVLGTDDSLGNYTSVTRDGKSVKVEDNTRDNWVEDDKKWDLYSGYMGRKQHWGLGGGDITDHICTHFKNGATHELLSELFSKKRRTKCKSDTDKDYSEARRGGGGRHSESCEEDMDVSAADISLDGEGQISVKKEHGVCESSTCEETKVRNNFIKTVQIKIEPRDPALYQSGPSNTSRISDVLKEPVIDSDDSPVKSNSSVNSVNCENLNNSENCLEKHDGLEKHENLENSEKKVEKPPSISNGPVDSPIDFTVQKDKVTIKEENIDNCQENSPSKEQSTISENGVEESIKCDTNGNGSIDEISSPSEHEQDLSQEVDHKDFSASPPVTDESPEVCAPAAEKGLTETSADQSISEISDVSLILVDGDLEEEAYQHDEPPLSLTSESQEELGRRCVCISNIFRSLSCIPGNDSEMSQHPSFMNIFGRLLLLHHKHLPRAKAHKFEKDDTESSEELNEVCEDNGEWYWSYLEELRENTLVIFANICGHLNLSMYPEEICFPMLDGLLHWAVCPASCARDPLPTMSSISVLSPQRLVLEALCKLCIYDSNVDLLLATPPFERIVELFMCLSKLLANRKEQVPREFAIVLLSQLVQGDSSAARAIALQHPCISLLVDFLETAEQNALQVANSQGINALQNNPEIMGTSLDMLRRSAMILLHLARIPENRSLFVHQQGRLLSLVMSQILDQTVANILSDVLYECSH
ncbi:trithorax group protein osa-like isoform X4 [Gigantopelta aegis]|uniref:trithorax group protein osa-like isoform X4 n=1 Tax=Gigantopelta aegis TaxID=1735272 RepID=UPI001B88D2A4|nr:trithorax group protein osa-like isoform X4 [Gigantopelta aegis]